MSNVVDTMIAELQFNNQNFESNAKTSLSTLERLKVALNFSEGTANFEKISKSVKNIDVNGLTSGVSRVSSALTNMVKIAGFRIISDEVHDAWQQVKNFNNELSQLNGLKGMTAGFDKYSQKTTAVQTIMAATAKEFDDTGKQMEYVNEQLDKLNWFTDETSYKFIDMVGNIGKFTSNNVSLEDSVTAMQGISTWAAKSGAGVNEASRAMYNLSQAISVGAVKLMDWKSIENANMATAEFKEMAMETAAELGTLTKVTDGLYKTNKGTEVSVTSFNQTLQDEWFTSKALIDTLGKYGEFTNKLYDAMERVDVDTASQMLDYIEEFKAGTLDINEAAKNAGVSAAEMKEILTELGDPALDFGRKAFRAAQEAKTFSEAIEATKDAVSSQWMNTWEIIFGDYEQAKGFWTRISEDLWTIFASGGETRNKYLKEAFQTEAAVTKGQWDSLLEQGIISPDFIHAVRKSAAEHGASIKEMASDEEWLSAAINKGLISVQDLEAGYSSVFGSSGIAAEVDENLKSQVESLKDSSEEFRNLFDILEKNKDADATKIIFGDGSYAEGYEDLEAAMDKMLAQMGLSQSEGEKLKAVLQSMGYLGGNVASAFDKMSDAQLKEIGWTDKQIEAFRKAKAEGKDLHAVIDDISKQNMTGSELFTGGLHNALSAVANLVTTIRESFNETFNGLSAGGLRDILQGFYEGTAKIAEFTKNSETLKNVFRALGSVANLVFSNISESLKHIPLTGVITGFGKFVNAVSKAILSLTEFINKYDLIGAASDFISSKLNKAVNAVKGWIDSFTKIPIVSRNISRIKTVFGSLPQLFGTAKTGVKNFFDSFRLTGGMKNAAFGDVIKSFKENVLDLVSKVPSIKAIGAAFTGIKSDIKGALGSVGIDIDGIIAKVISFKDHITGAFVIARDTVMGFGTRIKDAFIEFKSLPTVQRVIGKFGDGFTNLRTKIGPFFSETGTKLSNFFKDIVGMERKLNLETIGNIFEKFKGTLKDIWDSENNPFKDILDSAKNLGGELSKKFINFKGLDGLKQAFSNVKDTVIGFFTGDKGFADIGKTIAGFRDSVIETFGDTDFAAAISEKFSAVREAISNFLTDHGINVDGLVNAFNTVKDAVLGIFSGDFSLDTTTITNAFSNIEETVENVKQKIIDFFEAKGINVDGIIEALDRIKAYFASIFEGFEIPTSLSSFFDLITGTITAEASEANSKTQAIEEEGNQLTETFNTIAEKLKEVASIAGPKIEEAVRVIRENLDSIAEAAGPIGVVLEKIGKPLIAILGLKMLFKTGKSIIKNTAEGIKDMSNALSEGTKGILGAVKGAIEEIGKITTAIADAINAYNADMKAAAKLKKAKANVLTVIAFIGAILGILFAVKLINDMDPLDLATGLTTVFLITSILLVIMAVMSAIGPKGLGAAASVFLLVLSILGIMGLIKLLERYKINIDAIKERIGSIAILAAVLIGLVALTKLLGSGTAGAAVSILVMVGAIAALCVVAALIGMVPVEQLDRGIEAVQKLAIVVALFVVVAGMFGGSAGDMVGLAVSLIAMSIAIGAFAGVAKSLGQLDPAQLEQGVAAVAVLATIMAMVLVAANYAKGGAGAILSLAIAVGIIAVVMGALGEMDPDALIRVTVCLGVVMGVLALLGIVGKMLAGAASGIIALVAVFAIIAGAFVAIAVLLNEEQFERFQKVAIVMSVAFLAIGLAMLAISAAGTLAIAALPGMAGLLVAFIALTAIIIALGYACQEIEGLQGMIETGCQVLVMIAGAIGEAIGAFIGNAITGLMEGLDGSGEAIVDLFKELEPLNGLEPLNDKAINQAIKTILKISLAGFADSILSIGTEIQSGKSAAEQFAADVTAVASALKEWDSAFEEIDTLEFDGEGITDLKDKILDISLTGFGDSLLSIGTEIQSGRSAAEQFSFDVASLATALKIWDENMDSIGEITVPTEGLNQLVDAIGEVSFTGFASGLESIVTEAIEGKSSMEQFSTDALGLAALLEEWQTEMEAIGEITVPTEKIDDLVSEIGKINSKSLIDTVGDKISEFVAGKTQMESFRDDALALATTLGEWQTEMEAIGEVTVPKDAIDDLVAALEEVPSGGGLFSAVAGFFTGYQDFEGFKDNLETLGESVKGFVDALGENLDTSTLTTAAEAVKLLSTMGTDLKGQDFGGWFHEGDMTLFGGELVTLGEKLAEFASYEIDTEKLSSLADSAQTLGTFGKFVGDISISEDNVTGLETAIQKLQTATEDLNAIDLSSSDIMDTGKVNKFKTNVETMITAIKEAQNVKGGVSGFIDAIDEINGAALKAAQSAQNQVNDVDVDTSDVGNKMATSTASGISDSADAVTGAMNDVIAQAAELAGAAADQFNNVGVGFMTSMMLGITMTGSIISTAVESVVSSAVSSASAYNDQFETAGSNMVQGLANGISNNASAAINAAAQVARDALAKAKAELQIKSPSRKMMEVGNFFVEGFAKGIRDNTYHAVAVSKDMASEALSSFKGASEAIRDILTGDFDGDPVIRPVLDLSNVEAGSHRLSDMFNSRMPIGVSTNVRAINGSMADRNAVSNTDILDALNRLNSNLSNVKGGDTFQVNGITYDDGSNISTAVRDLIRTVRVGRRM